MTDIPKPSGKVLRRNPELECGQPIGQLAIKIKKNEAFELVSFYCNQPRLHTDGCKFVGSELIVSQKPRPIILNHP
jgi:hypothetical protein